MVVIVLIRWQDEFPSLHNKPLITNQNAAQARAKHEVPGPPTALPLPMPTAIPHFSGEVNWQRKNEGESFGSACGST